MSTAGWNWRTGGTRKSNALRSGVICSLQGDGRSRHQKRGPNQGACLATERTCRRYPSAISWNVNRASSIQGASGEPGWPDIRIRKSLLPAAWISGPANCSGHVNIEWPLKYQAALAFARYNEYLVPHQVVGTAADIWSDLIVAWRNSRRKGFRSASVPQHRPQGHYLNSTCQFCRSGDFTVYDAYSTKRGGNTLPRD